MTADYLMMRLKKVFEKRLLYFYRNREQIYDEFSEKFWLRAQNEKNKFCTEKKTFLFI
jgi:hypothetical protein